MLSSLPSFLSWGQLLRWKVREWKGQGWSSDLKVLISASLWKSNALPLSSGTPSLIFLSFCHHDAQQLCYGKVIFPMLMLTDYIFISIWNWRGRRKPDRDSVSASTRKIWERKHIYNMIIKHVMAWVISTRSPGATLSTVMVICTQSLFI